jgi:hypothetical protein
MTDATTIRVGEDSERIRLLIHCLEMHFRPKERIQLQKHKPTPRLLVVRSGSSVDNTLDLEDILRTELSLVE